MHLLPDGSEEVIPRRGPASIAENKNLLKIGATLGVRALVTEMMSIHPENIFTESARFIQPHVLVVTNIRPDHVAQMGPSRASVAQTLSAAISPKATVVLPEKEHFPIFDETAKQRGATIVQVPDNEKLDMSKFPNEHEENVRLSLAVADLLDIDTDTAIDGMQKAQPDFGAPRIWKARVGSDAQQWHLVSLFAANDPLSTRQALDRIIEKRLLPAKKTAGLICLRRDRGDRSLLWRDALAKDLFPELRYVFLCGEHASAIASRLRADARVQVVEETKPVSIMTEIERAVQDEIILVGMGNMGGLGQMMLSLWNEVGVRL
jgi:poly-gamma-glutamate synthase PgsB/CapB